MSTSTQILILNNSKNSTCSEKTEIVFKVIMMEQLLGVYFQLLILHTSPDRCDYSSVSANLMLLSKGFHADTDQGPAAGSSVGRWGPWPFGRWHPPVPPQERTFSTSRSPTSLPETPRTGDGSHPRQTPAMKIYFIFCWYFPILWVNCHSLYLPYSCLCKPLQIGKILLIFVW